jgi:hypothetical protein
VTDEFRPFPAAVLIYAAIDCLGSLRTIDGYATGESYKNWVTDYLLPAKPLPCSASDLWGARNGMLHTMRYDNQRPEPGQKIILIGTHNNHEEISNITDPTIYVGGYLEDLRDALIIAGENYLDFLNASTDMDINANLDKLPKYIDLIQLL